MIISSRGRYALRVMIDLAQHDNGELISLKDIAERQEISMKYLELIVSTLNKGGMLISGRGKKGGYRLKHQPEEYSVGSILKLTRRVDSLARDVERLYSHAKLSFPAPSSKWSRTMPRSTSE